MGQEVFMTKGDGEHGYSKNSTSQRSITDGIVFPVLDEVLQRVSLPPSEKPIVVADLGCSCGPNTIVNASYVVEALRSRGSDAQREIQIFFNDLPGNDFNALFKLLCDDDANRSKYFAAGVPGSMYNRLFPPSSVHVFVSYLAAHFLSRVPDSITDEKSPSFNKSQLWLEGSTDATEQAFKQQSLLDLKSLLQARSEELVSGGLLYFILKTRQAPKHNALNARDDSVDAVQICLRETADEILAQGILTKQQLISLNVPLFYPLFKEELLDVVRSFESSFEILKAEEMGWPMFFPPGSPSDPDFAVKAATGFARGVLGGIFEQVMGSDQQEIFWQHFARIAMKYASDFEQVCHFGCIAVLKR